MVNLAGARNKHVPFVFDADAVEYDDDDDNEDAVEDYDAVVKTKGGK